MVSSSGSNRILDLSITDPHIKTGDSSWAITDFLPRPILSQFIHRIYYLESLARPTHHSELWIPSGTVELVIDLEAPFKQALVGEEMKTRPQAFITGLFEKCLSIKPTGTIRQIGVVFKIGAFCRFSDLPYSKIKGQIIPLPEVFGKDAARLLSSLDSCPSVSDMMIEVQSFLCGRLSSQRFTDNPFIDQSITTIDRYQGYVAVSTLLDGHHISPRHFRRVFKRYTGISPKKYARLIRLMHLVRKAREKEMSLSTLADIHGFYDVSHVYHEFKKATGMFPQQYLQYPQPLSQLFFQ